MNKTILCSFLALAGCINVQAKQHFELSSAKGGSELSTIVRFDPPIPHPDDPNVPMILSFDPPIPHPDDPNVPMILSFDPPIPHPDDPNVPMGA